MRDFSLFNFKICNALNCSFHSEGNQYTYKGNEFNAKTQSSSAVNDAVNNAIGNQEIGKSPIEYTN